MPRETNYTVCPNCQAIFGIDEIQEQCCFSCGWPEEEDDWGQEFDDDLYD